jgi:hypothetical protein
MLVLATTAMTLGAAPAVRAATSAILGMLMPISQGMGWRQTSTISSGWSPAPAREMKICFAAAESSNARSFPERFVRRPRRMGRASKTDLPIRATTAIIGQCPAALPALKPVTG